MRILRRRGYRKRLSRGRIRRMVLFVITAVVITATGVLGVRFYQYMRESNYFKVKDIEVAGAYMVSPENVVAQSGVTNADSLLFLDPDAVASNVERIPYVHFCEVTAIFPDKLRITIVERVAIATLLVDDAIFELDEEATVLRQLNPYHAYTGPLITNVPEIAKPIPGDQVPAAPLRDAIEVWGAFAQSDMAGDVTISELAAYSESDIRMYCDELPFEIRWGRDHFVDAAYRLDLWWRLHQKRPPFREYVDLRFDGDVVCR